MKMVGRRVGPWEDGGMEGRRDGGMAGFGTWEVCCVVEELKGRNGRVGKG